MTATSNNELQYRHRRTLKGTISNKVMSAKKRARKDEMSFNISTPLMHEIWEKQQGKCAKTGVEMGRIGDKWTSPSIDRIDSSRGYEHDNVQWVCWRYNDAKSNMNDDQFVAMCLAVAATYFKELNDRQKR
jgi:GH43 family beta-xylosidase